MLGLLQRQTSGETIQSEAAEASTPGKGAVPDIREILREAHLPNTCSQKSRAAD
ncbi:hypothetical protein GCM10022248_25600 [Nonomuraea soli]